MKYAWDGLMYAISSQPNFRVHLFLSVLAIGMGLILRISILEWIVIFMSITLGLVIELVNTSIEETVDLVTKEYNIFAKRAKDTAAAAMFIYAVGSAVLGSLIFLPKIWIYILG
jgi:diacylglycerol kinase